MRQHNEEKQQTQQLQNAVNAATNINELIPFLSLISLQSMKDTLQQQIRNSNVTKRKQTYYTALSIVDIVPVNILLLICSFNDSFDLHNISKRFRQIAKKQQIKAVQFNSQPFKCVPFANDNNYNTLIVDCNRKTLNSSEKQQQYKGPFKTIKKAIEKCKSGDKILIYNGVYECERPDDKHIQFIGIGDKVVLRAWNILLDCQANLILNADEAPVKCKVNFENIEINYHHRGKFEVGRNSEVWMKNCKIICPCDIRISEDSFAYFKDCTFIGQKGYEMRIWANCLAQNVEFLGCTFIDSYVQILGERAVRFIGPYKAPEQSLKLKCIGNVFGDNRGRHPISQIDDVNYDKVSCVIKHNVIQGYHSWRKQLTHVDANKVHVIIK